jgi:hypothetical protein
MYISGDEQPPSKSSTHRHNSFTFPPIDDRPPRSAGDDQPPTRTGFLSLSLALSFILTLLGDVVCGGCPSVRGKGRGTHCSAFVVSDAGRRLRDREKREKEVVICLKWGERETEACMRFLT